MKKRILSTVLALALCLGLLPAGALAQRESALAAASDVTYSPKRLEAVVLPIVAAEDSAFVRDRVRTKDSLFNIDSSFHFVSGKSLAVDCDEGSNRETLSPGLSFMHSENKSWSATYQWNFAENYDVQKTTQINELIKQGQLTVWAQAKLTPDRHRHIGEHKDVLTDRAKLTITDQRNGVEILRLQNSSSDADEVGKRMEGSGIPKDVHYLGFQVHMSKSDCSCGSSRVSRVYIHLSDNTAPTVTAVYPSDAGGSKTAREYYKAGETVYFTMEFSESIRFADDQPHAMQLELGLLDNATGVTSTTLPSISADLTTLTGNKLIFSYIVPDTPMDVRVGAVSAAAQSWVNSETALAILDAGGNILDNTTFISKSPITDLAGNAMVWTSSVTMSPRTVIDTIPAELVRISASASMAGEWKPETDGGWPADIPASAIWAGPDDSVSFTVVLNEEVGYWHSGKNQFARFDRNAPVYATTNLIDAGGNAVVIRLSNAEYQQLSVNDGKHGTILYFDPATVKGGMYLDGDHFRITELTTGSAGGFIDPAGNAFTPNLDTYSPQEKFKLDVTAPMITSDAPLPETDATGTNVFYRTVPFTITDDGCGVDVESGAAKVAVSGWLDATVTCCVTESAETPADDRFASEAKFSYINPGETMYLHIRAEKAAGVAGTLRLNYTIKARDNAGNQASAAGKITIGTDTSAPVIQSGGIGVNTQDYQLYARVQVSDETGLSIVKYWWEVDGTPGEETVLPASTSRDRSFTASLDGLSGKTGSATLHVYAEDPNGKSTEETFGPLDFDFTAQTANYTVGQTTIPTLTPVLTIDPPANTVSGDVETDIMTLAIIGIDGGSGGFDYNVYFVGQKGIGDENAVLEPFSAASAIQPKWVCQRPADLLTTTGGEITLGFAEALSTDVFANFAENANGDVEVFLVTMPESNLSGDNGVLTVDASTTIEHFTIACGKGRSNSITAGNPSNSGGEVLGNVLVRSNTTIPDTPVQTLTGLSVPITVTPNRQASFNFQDLDFSGARAWLVDRDGTTVLEDSEQLLTAPTIGASSYTFNYRISSELSGVRGHYKLCVEIPYIESMQDEARTSEKAEFYLFMDDEPFDGYYPVKYRQFYGANNGDDPGTLNIADRTVELVSTDGAGNASYASQLVIGLAETPMTHYRYTANRTLAFSATRYGKRLPLQVWTGETEPTDWITYTSDPDGYYVLTPALGEGYDADCNNDDSTLTLQAGENRVYYRVMLPNGTVTPTRVLNVTAGATTPQATLDFTHTAGDSFVAVSVTPSDDGYTENQMDITGNKLYVQGGFLYPAEVLLDAARQVQLEIGEENAFLGKLTNFCLVDSYGNLGVAVCEGDEVNYSKEDAKNFYNAYNVSEMFDLLAPTVTCSVEPYSYGGDGAYYLQISLIDTEGTGWTQGSPLCSGMDFSNIQVSVSYQDTTREDVVRRFTVPLPALDSRVAFINGDAPFGIESVSFNSDSFPNEDRKWISISGVLPFDARAVGDKVFTVTASDLAGNVSVQTATWSLETEIPEQITFTQDRPGENSFTSSSSVRLLSPIEEDYMGTNHYDLPFYKSGTYTVRFMDPLGNIYTQDVEYVGADYLDVAFSTTDDTADPVTVTITKSGSYSGEGTGNLLGYTLESVAGTSHPLWEDATQLPEGTTTFEVTVSANDTIHIWQDRDSSAMESYSSANDAVRVTNIVTKPKTPPASTAQVGWYDGDGQKLDPAAEGPVTGPVTALVECADDELTGDTRRMFPCGTAKGEGYTFVFTDSYGNEGEITATLPWDVVSAEEGGMPADDTAPVYKARLYQYNNNLWRQLATFDSRLLGVEVDGQESPQSPANLSGAMVGDRILSWQVAFSVEDESRTKLVVKRAPGEVTYASEHDTDLPAELTVGAASLTWTGEEESPLLFVYFVDSAGNATGALEVRFPGVYVPGKPRATVEYVRTGPTVRAYLVPVENMEEYTVDDLDHKLTQDNEGGEYQGLYYYEFTENGTYTFRFTNADGKSGTVTATVSTIDNREMEVTNVSFLVGGKKYGLTLGADGKTWEQTADKTVSWDTADPDTKTLAWDQTGIFTNVNVVAEIYTNLTIQSAMSSDGTLPVSYAANKATVVLGENAGSVSLILTGRNGKGMALVLPAITCIDQTPPVVTSADGALENGAITVSGGGARRKTLTFTTDEPTCLDGNAEYKTEHTYEVSVDGAYTLIFADQAGNVTGVTLTVVDLEGKLAMEFSRNSDGDPATTNPGEDWKNAPLQGGQSFYVRFTRNVTASLAGEAEKDCAKGVWHAFTVPNDGGLLTLRATDMDGDTIYAYLRASSADTRPPVILFDEGTLYGRAGMAEAEQQVLLKGGVSVKDDSGEELTYNMDASAVDWTAAGSYTIFYTAKDSSGNEAAATRTLVLIAEDLPELVINGEAVVPFSTVVLPAREITLEISGVEGDLFVSVKPGRLTEAQMKIGAEALLANEGYEAPLSHTLTGSGFHTLYIRTQDRSVILIYLYVTG